MEVLTQLNKPEEKNEVMDFLKFVITLLPGQYQDPFLRFLVYLNNVDTVSSADVDAAALDAFGDEHNDWSICGVVAGSSVRRKVSEGLFSRAQDGYLCGLWMLFHYLTVAAEERFMLSISEVLSSSAPSPVTITAIDVMENIRLCVDKFFNCRHCRLHFLENYSKCLFGRCDIEKSQFDKVQKWLWEFHNFVTQSILHWHLSPENREDGTENYFKNEVSWPHYKTCSSCYSEQETRKHSTITASMYIRNAYWDKSWKLHTLRDYKPEYAHALRNPFASSKTLSKGQESHPAISALHQVSSTIVTSSSSNEVHKSNEETLFTLGIVSSVGVLLMVVIAFYLSFRKKSNYYSANTLKRGRY